MEAEKVQMQAEPRTLRNLIKKKLQNLICSEQICGICFECDDGIHINTALEITSDERNHVSALGNVYCSVFNETLENLASNTICNRCTDQLIQSYIFIQNSKCISLLLSKYVVELESTTKGLKLKDTNLDSSICIVLDGNGMELKTKMFGDNKVKRNNNEKVQNKFTTSKLAIYKTHSKIVDPNLYKSRIRIQKRKIKVKTKQLMTEETEIMQCVMCLRKINSGQDHNCQFICPHCKEVSCVHFAYLTHYRDQAYKNLDEKVCLTCDFVCRNKETLISHVNKHHLDINICDIYNQKFHTKSAVQNHILQHKKFSILKMNDDNSEAIFQRENRQLIVKDNGDVRYSSDKIINPELKHSESLLNKCKKQSANITCEMCGYKTWNSILLECHLNRYHLKKTPYICHICSKNFVGKHLLKKHINSHNIDQRVICNICGKKLANSSCLKSHLKIHTGEKNYPCDICGERFRSSSIMNVHKKKKHSEREAACPLCFSKFYTLVELRRHIAKIHWKKNTKFDPRKLEGLENHYHIFHDGRRIRMGADDVDFYMPC